MRYLYFAILALACAISIPTASAQISIVPYFGYGANAGANLDNSPRFFDGKGGFFGGIGVELEMPIQGPMALKVRPSVEYYLLSGFSDSTSERIYKRTQSRVQLNADMIAEFQTDASLSPYVGAGIFWSRWGFKENEERTNVIITSSDSWSGFGVNLLAGAQLGSMGLGIPFVEIGYRYQLWGVELFSKELYFNGLFVATGISIPLGN